MQKLAKYRKMYLQYVLRGQNGVEKHGWPTIVPRVPFI